MPIARSRTSPSEITLRLAIEVYTVLLKGWAPRQGGTMSLGVAVFASVVLVLAVYHKGFRKVLLWTGAAAAALALLAVGSYFGTI